MTVLRSILLSFLVYAWNGVWEDGVDWCYGQVMEKQPQDRILEYIDPFILLDSFAGPRICNP